MPQPGQLSRMIAWAHQLLAEVIRPGDTLVDLTAGNGHDSLFLAGQAGGNGQLLAFDIQSQALNAATERLTAAGFNPVRITRPDLLTVPGIFLIEDGHENLAAYLTRPVRAALANLGYLPGSDKRITTRPKTTIAAIRALLANLVEDGRLAVVVYRGHPGSFEEIRQLEAFLNDLPPDDYVVLRLESPNQHNAPGLLLVERRPVVRS